MLQLSSEIELLGIGLLVIGFLFVAAAFLSLYVGRKESDHIVSENKGVILIGPIPIVWGYGRKGWLVALAVALALWITIVIVF